MYINTRQDLRGNRIFFNIVCVFFFFFFFFWGGGGVGRKGGGGVSYVRVWRGYSDLHS